MLLYYPYFCATKIINAMEQDVSADEFVKTVKRNRSGVDSADKWLPIWESIDVTTYYPLKYASAIGDISKVRILLKAGADPNIKDRQFSPLYDSLIICENGDQQKQMDESVSLFKRLLEHCQPVDYHSNSGTLLGCAEAFGNQKAVEYILEERINDVYDVSKIGRTALMSSVMPYNNYEMCCYLIEKGADKNVKDSNGKTAYDYAVEFGRDKCIEVLLARGK